MTILAMVNADKEGQVESKMMKAVRSLSHVVFEIYYADNEVETIGRDSRSEEE